MNMKQQSAQPQAANGAQQPEKKQGLLSTLLGGNKSKSAPQKQGLPKTAQQTIPYVAAYSNGIIESLPGIYSKTYPLEDVNFKIASPEEQQGIFTRFGEFLSMFNDEINIQISMFNREIDQASFRDKVLLKYKGDALDTYREESNNILLAHMSEGHNSLAHEKYITISFPAANIDAAIQNFARLDSEINTSLKRMNGAETRPLTIEERLSIFYDIFNAGKTNLLTSSATIDGRNVAMFDLRTLQQQGLTTKDAICPESFLFKTDSFMMGDRFARILFLDNLPSYLSTNFLAELGETAEKMLISVHYDPLRMDQAIRLVKNQITNIDANVIDAQKRATKSGYSAELISPDLSKAHDEANELLEDLTSRNQKLFFLSLVALVYADTEEELAKTTALIQTTAQKYMCVFKKLPFQQEQGLATALPLGINCLSVKRLLTTESASLFIPFSAQEYSQERGMYYGLNAVSHNLILFNRTNSKNANGVILGTPGAGKSFSAKREMLNVILGTNDDVYIIDPEREYTPMVEMLGGEVVRIAAGSKTYINPFDMDIEYADEDDPITLKSDFIGSLCETIIGGHYGLSPIQKSVIDRCVRQIYQPYMAYMRTAPAGVTCDKERAPTLMDFYEMLMTQPEPEAQNLALALELYVTGSLDTFAHKTNVNTSSRFVVYDIKDIGSGMKEMGLQVCLNAIWNQIIENKQRYRKRTWFYIDEFYLLTQTASSARFLQQVYKRARKWLGVPTGITQNVEDLLASAEARGIINNCDFIMMLNQSPLDRIELGKLLNISPAQMSYITNADAGQGLLYTGKSIVPFIDRYPTNTRSFKAMTTKIEDTPTPASQRNT